MSKPQQTLAKITKHLPNGGELRSGQIAMAEAVTNAIAEQKTLLIEAGTGTGKSFAYLAPIIESGQKAIITTATIALQTQLLDIDAPFVAKALDSDTRIAILKGKNNYICQQKLNEITQDNGQTALLPDPEIVKWATRTQTGDREELQTTTQLHQWGMVSVSSDECPGPSNCPAGSNCFFEKAKAKSHASQITITNHHYYSMHLNSEQPLLPEHEILVIDEAHQFPEILGRTCATTISGARLRDLVRKFKSVIEDPQTHETIEKTASRLDETIASSQGQALDIDAQLLSQLIIAREQAVTIMSQLRSLENSNVESFLTQRERALQSASRIIDDINSTIDPNPTDLTWVDDNVNPALHKTPLELSELTKALNETDSIILTSATLDEQIGTQLGLIEPEPLLQIPSPFNYSEQAVLYCPTDLPSARSPEHRQAAQTEMLQLIKAANGRALCLFTSYQAMHAAAERFQQELSIPVLLQGEASKKVLIENFKQNPTSVLVATTSFWQGIDLPGDTVLVVAIDRLPFPRPDDPLVKARRERAGPTAFKTVDLPQAKIMLAQAAGRLIRRTSDQGVVAVLDKRLAKAKSYRWELINALPPFKRSKDRTEVIKLLRELSDKAANSPNA